MKFSAGIFLLVVGAILAFAVRDAVDFVDLTLIGYILMGAGVVGILIAAMLTLKGNRSTTTTRSAVDPATGEGVSRTEHSIS